jgi:Sap, sulfolipid-1-addressing protein
VADGGAGTNAERPRGRDDRATVGQAIGQVLSFGVGVAISPLPIVAVVLMLATPRARSNGPAFLAGWLAGMAIAGGIVLAVSNGADASSDGAPADWVSWLKIILGLLLLLVAVRQWRGRPKGDAAPEMPKWMRALDTFAPPKALGAGAVLSGVNPKNLILTVGAAAAIAQTGAATGSQIAALAVFAVIGSLGVGAPVAIYFGMGERSEQILGGLKDWMARNNTAVMAVLCLVIGAKLIGDAVGALAA